MRTLAPWTEQFQHFTTEVREQFWDDVYRHTREVWQRGLERLSVEARDRYLGVHEYERGPGRADHRNGFYERDLVTLFGTRRLRIARTRRAGLLAAGAGVPATAGPRGDAADSGGVFARDQHPAGGAAARLLTAEPISAQTVSQVTRDLDQAVRRFHQAPLGDAWRYLFLDGISLRVRRPSGRQRVQLLVASGIRADGTRQRRACTRSQGESQAAWEGLLEDLYRRGLHGTRLALIVTDGCAGLAAALQTSYPRVAHQRCWVHKLRNLLGAVRRRDHAAVKADAQASSQAASRREAAALARQFGRRWQTTSPKLVASLQRDLPQLLAFFGCPSPLWRRLRTTNIIERCFVEVRRRTRVRCQRAECGTDYLLHLQPV